MIKDERNYHLRLQEFCDCFMETDYKKELEAASGGASGDPGGDPDELALKVLGLTVLYGVNEEARKISLQRSKEGKVSFAVEARGDYQLPPPSTKVADRVISIARSITHIDKDKGKSPLSLGLRSDRMEIKLEFDRKGGGESLSLVFPKS